MLLQPKRFTYKSIHRKRVNITRINKFKLNFGSVGLVLLQPAQINSKKLFRIKLFLKKSARKVDITARRVWLNAFPHIPLTKKSVGSRMGKGKGKVSI